MTEPREAWPRRLDCALGCQLMRPTASWDCRSTTQAPACWATWACTVDRAVPPSSAMRPALTSNRVSPPVRDDTCPGAGVTTLRSNASSQRPKCSLGAATRTTVPSRVGSAMGSPRLTRPLERPVAPGPGRRCSTKACSGPRSVRKVQRATRLPVAERRWASPSRSPQSSSDSLRAGTGSLTDKPFRLDCASRST